MADSNADPATNREGSAGPPRWVKLSVTISIVVVGLFLVLLVVRGPGGGGHGPARHLPTPSLEQP